MIICDFSVLFIPVLLFLLQLNCEALHNLGLERSNINKLWSVLLCSLDIAGIFALDWDISSLARRDTSFERLSLELFFTCFSATLVSSSLLKSVLSAKVFELITEFVRCVGGLC